MANVNNSGTVTGRLAADPVSFINADGSKKVMLTVYADRNFKNSTTGQRDSDRVSLETFVRVETDGLGIFGHMHKGDLVSLGYTVRSGSYADKLTGEVIYFQVLRVEDVSLLESLATTNERLAARLSAVQDQPAPVATKTRNTRQKAAVAA